MHNTTIISKKLETELANCSQELCEYITDLKEDSEHLQDFYNTCELLDANFLVPHAMILYLSNEIIGDHYTRSESGLNLASIYFAINHVMNYGAERFTP